MSDYGYVSTIHSVVHRCGLKTGDTDSTTDDSVSKLRDLLSEAGYKFADGSSLDVQRSYFGIGAVDNKYDNALAEVVKRFQRDENLPQTGVADYGTWRLLGVDHSHITTHCKDRPAKASDWKPPGSAVQGRSSAASTYADQYAPGAADPYSTTATPSSTGSVPSYLQPGGALTVDKSSAKGLIHPTTAQQKAITKEIGPFVGTGSYRDVLGSGGWKYRQFADGDVYVLLKPSGGSLPEKKTEEPATTVPDKKNAQDENKGHWLLWASLGLAGVATVGGVVWFLTRPAKPSTPKLATTNRKKKR